jgi:hypothetical protein
MTASHTVSALVSGHFGGFFLASVVGLLGTGWVGFSAADAVGQTIVYRPIVTGFAPAAGPYVANYNPSGNYAAVSAFSPPVAAGVPMAAISTPLTAVVPSSSVAVTSYSVPAMTTVARPVTAYYAPSYAGAPTYAATQTYAAAPMYAAAPTVVGYAPSAQLISPASVPVAMTSYYAPASTANYAPTMVYAAAPVAVAQPVQMVPTAVAVPLYRRGPFGGLRPVRGAYWPAY